MAERKLPSGADLAASGYRGYNTDVGTKAAAGPGENKSAVDTVAEDTETKATAKKAKKKHG